MEHRITALEKSVEEMRQDLKSLLQFSARIEGKIEGLPSAYEFGQLKGRVDSLPTFAKLGAMLGFFTAAIAIMNNWPAISALFFRH